MSELAPSRVGELVGGKYAVVRFLAQGGMGAVYEAVHVVIKRRFAIKFLHRDLATRRESLSRFQREAQAAGALESQHVTAAVDFGITGDGSPYIVMEFLVGEDLRASLERAGRLTVERATDLVLQACRGVQAAHEAGILHRDLKPENLFLCRREDGTDLLKILDFGVAKLQDFDEKSGATRSGAVLGTTSYLSPEQARGEPADERTDVYALGAILYELLSGARPHPGNLQHAVLFHIATQPPVPLPSLQPELPAALIDVVNRAIASDREQRFASAEQLGLALAKLTRRDRSSPHANAMQPTAEFASNGAVVLVDAATSPPPVRRLLRRWIILGAALAASLLLGAASRHVPSRATVPPTANLPATRDPAPLQVVTATGTVPAPDVSKAPPPSMSSPPSPLPPTRPPKESLRPRPRVAPESTAGLLRSRPSPFVEELAPAGSTRTGPISFDQTNPYK